jgi:hypothetical protein
MKIAITTVSKDGFGDSTAFESRFERFKEALEQVRGEGVQLLCLPGGYFCVKSEAELKEAKSRIVQEAKRAGIAVAVGIDCSQEKNSNKKQTTSPDTEHLVRTQTLPSFVATWSPKHEHIWRQRSVNSKDQWCVPEKVCKRPQTLHVSGKKIEILACGELFNERIRNSIVAGHPSAVVDLSHDGKGFRADHSLRLLAHKGMYTFCCTHANMKGAIKRGFAPNEDKISTSKTDFVIAGEPRIEMKVWEI